MCNMMEVNIMLLPIQRPQFHFGDKQGNGYFRDAKLKKQKKKRK